MSCNTHVYLYLYIICECHEPPSKVKHEVADKTSGIVANQHACVMGK